MRQLSRAANEKRADPYISFMIAAAKKALIAAGLDMREDKNEDFNRLDKQRVWYHRIFDGRDAQLSASELRVVDTRERIEENEPVLHSVCDYEYGWGVSRDGFEIYGAKLFHRRDARQGIFA